MLKNMLPVGVPGQRKSGGQQATPGSANSSSGGGADVGNTGGETGVGAQQQQQQKQGLAPLEAGRLNKLAGSRVTSAGVQGAGAAHSAVLYSDDMAVDMVGILELMAASQDLVDLMVSPNPSAYCHELRLIYGDEDDTSLIGMYVTFMRRWAAYHN